MAEWACAAFAAASPAGLSVTPMFLSQLWMSNGPSVSRDVSAFSQRSLDIFSNYTIHALVVLDIPSYCRSAELAKTGRSAQITFTFAEQAIMACKASLFGDWASFDKILHCKDSWEAKGLGRGVKPWNQDLWDRTVCQITRDVIMAKAVGLPALQTALAGTGDAMIAEATRGDHVWGINLDPNHPHLRFPGRWKGSNILGWALMEARDAAGPKRPLPSAPVIDDRKSSIKRQRGVGNTCSIDDISSGLDFGLEAFGPLQRSVPVHQGGNNLHRQVKVIIEESVPDARTMRGERGNKYVTRMLSDIYQSGLFMHGGPDSAVNSTVIPAIRHVFEEIYKLKPNDEKRIATIRALVEACQDCQQVQARVILRTYGDFTSQAETFEKQLKYSLVRQKEAALQVLISKSHRNCDLDHTEIKPEQQRAHLLSGYTVMVGNDFGLDGIDAARSDRFLSGALQEIQKVQGKVNLIHDSGTCDGVLSLLKESICVKEWLSALIGDINNQSDEADRLIDRACIFEWADKNMEGDFKHRVFYDDSREKEFEDLHPTKPNDDNMYQPFLSPKVLVEMLLKANMLK
uniref:NADAR domain-containing protein n=1 Tax=Odontella aurita TaxID=265563 RepID=A0A7S4JXG7_9STRA|mmetsp:Transcript_55731/g.167013  ORF Transcript_55731/g.167013 Transcript_55731/m.167013 type:complete len:573 (+) Transcript_55731:120-1838(+)